MTDQNTSDANGRVIPAVAITGQPSRAALDRLQHVVPAGASVYAVNPDAGDLPEGVRALTTEGPGPDALARALAGAEPGAAWVILAAELEVPPLAVARLARIGLTAPGAGVVSPLTNRVPALSPLPPGMRVEGGVDAAWLDGVVYAAGRRAYFDVDAAPLDCAWWHPEALAGLASTPCSDDERPARLRTAGWRCLAADHLYIQDPGRPLAGPAEIAEEEHRPPAHPLAPLRERAREALSARDWRPQRAGLDGVPVLLHVVHSWGGGVERFTRDLIDADGERRHLVLAAAGSSAARSYGQVLRLHAGSPDSPVIREWRLPVPVHSLEDTAPGYAAVLDEILQDFAVDQVLVSSLIGHSLEVLRTGRPTAMVLHDYFPVCPALNIHFGEVCSSCREPRLTSCLEGNPFNRLFIDKDAAGWLELRDRFVATVLEEDIRLAVPTQGVERNLVRIEPRLADARFTHIPHGLTPWPRRADHPAATHEGRLRLVVPGRLKAGKGRDLLLAALPALREVADVWLVGCGKDETADFLGVSGVHLIFDYERDRLPALMDMIRPHAALLLSTVPETFSYTLSEMWSLDLPVVAVALGALAERVNDGENGMLVKPGPGALAEAVHVLAADPALHARLARGAAASQAPDLADMAAGYRRLLPLPAAAPCRYRLHDPDPALLVENALREELATARDRLARSRDRIAEQEDQLLRRASWGFRLEKKLAERTAWAKQQEEQLAERATVIRDLQQELEDRTAWARSLDAELTALRDEHARTVSLMESRMEGLERSLAEVRGDYEAVLASRSWRMTRPLRDLTTFLRRVRDSLRFRLGRFRTNANRAARTLETQGVGETLRRANQARQVESGADTDVTKSRPAPIEGPVRIPASDTPVASIVIPVYNNSALTRACLASIAEHAGSVALEVIVVDDESADDTPEMLAGVEGIRWMRNEKNRGFIDSCNRGADEARGEYLVFLNNDTTVTTGWLEALLDTFETFGDAGLVGAKLIYPDGRLQEAGGIIFNDGSGWNYGRGDDPDRPEYNFVREVDYCSGACIAVLRRQFEEMGRFDERYRPAYYEDTDLAFKVREAGLRVYYQPGCTIIHHEGATSGTDTATGAKRYQVVNQKTFRQRWSGQLAGHPAPGTDIGLAREHRLKGRVLIVDAVTPQPDQDSGSLRMVNLMRLFRSLGYGVTFFPDNLNAPQPYTWRLQQQGVEMQHLPWLHSPPQWFADNGHRFDAVILSRHYVARNYLWLARTHCTDAALLFDTVDLHFLRERRLAELEGRAALKKLAERTRREELGIARQSDVTLVVSPYEKEAMAREAPDVAVSVLSNIHEVHGRRRGFAGRRDIWFVGGFQHPPNIDAMRWFTGEIWPIIRSRLDDVRFHIVGSKMPPEIQSLSGEGIEVHGFVPDVVPFLDGCRLAVAPLRYGAGVKGKVNQSMSYGQPVVATATALEGMYATPGEDALVADDPEGFADAVVKAYTDEALWLKLSDNGLVNVERHFSFDAARRSLDEILACTSQKELKVES